MAHCDVDLRWRGSSGAGNSVPLTPAVPSGEGRSATTMGGVSYVRIGDCDLYSEVAGEGDPVLLLHGGFCSLEALRAPADALVVDHRVFAFERPGHGRSKDIDGEYGYERGVADTLAYLDAVGVESAHIVGY